jgi:4,5-dihydroxyphthalate decarboxylase
VRYRTGGLNRPGRIEKFRVDLPPEIDIAPIREGETLSGLLAVGELDAVYSPRAPETFGQGVDRLFADPRTVEEQYAVDTGIFPIMHVVVLHRRVYEKAPWVAQELVKAFERAKRLAYDELERTVALSLSLPWVREEYERTTRVLGADYWSYGLAANREVLATFVRYAAEQGLIGGRPSPEELFAVETTEQHVI